MRVGPQRKLSAEELMLSNCGAWEDPWESLGQQGDQTSQFQRKSTLNMHRKNWCWSWSSIILATWCEELTHLKRPWCWERLKAGGEGGRRRMRRLDGNSDLMNMSLSKLWETVKDRETMRAAAYGVAKSRSQLSNWITIIPLASWMPHNTEQSSMCYTVGPCWVSILSTVV